METPEDIQDLYDQTFIEAPAILDKHKAAAQIADGKSLFRSLQSLLPRSSACDQKWPGRGGGPFDLTHQINDYV